MNLTSRDGMSIECLEEQLGAMWGKFLQTVKFSGVDCLSLHHLGLVLKHLAQKGISASTMAQLEHGHSFWLGEFENVLVIPFYANSGKI